MECNSLKYSFLLQLEKSYFTKFTDRDAAEQKYKEISTQQLLQKEVEKVCEKLNEVLRASFVMHH